MIISPVVRTEHIIQTFIFYYDDVNHRNIIGKQLKLARLSSKPRITQNELAARLQTLGIAIDRTMLSKIESGIRPVYDYEANALAQALRIPIAHLFDNKSGKRANHPITRGDD